MIRLAFLGLFVLASGTVGRADEQRPEQCVLEIPVYGPTGSKLDFKITRVTGDADPNVNALLVLPKEFRANGDRLLFPKPMLRRSILIKLEDSMHHALSVKVPLFDCRQRTSARWGSNETSSVDLWALTLKGHLYGCTFSGDWWIRVMPMFGYPAAVQEGIIQSDGSFSLTASLFGERYTLVIGKDREPVKAVGVDVVSGKTNDVGSLDLSGSCPK